MLSKERMLRIMNILNSHSFVTIQELIQQLGVSKSTINRDLIELERQGLVKRERGGAMKVEMKETLNNLKEIPVREKEYVHREEKRRICKRAAERIQNGDCIYVDSGTTPSYLLEYLHHKDIKLVTPSTYIVRKLPMDFRGEIYLVGGEFNIGYDMSAGYHTLEMIRKFHFDKAFFSASGIDLTNGEVMSVDFSIGAVKEEVLRRSRECYLLADKSKLSIQALATWANLEQFDLVFTDEEVEGNLPDNFIVCK
ncbi:DeoR/GlpR family DNA-binding transcription regulator [Amedibacterium intestinale]|mgnify:FL=1|uniref:DeoR/GlpR family DNA-binding transcription regulator n=1 Tax=Amedibacterium intestinale TaxID=2583452 RepID=UPI000E20265F